jgi:hypothetical protein
LDIFEQTTSTNELAKKIVKELLIFRNYQFNVKDIKCPLQWWEKYEMMFLTKNIENLIFFNKKSNDPKIGCKFWSNFIKFLERDIDFKNELENFEREFERDEVVEV